jgi:hypothetical protein
MPIGFPIPHNKQTPKDRFTKVELFNGSTPVTLRIAVSVPTRYSQET